MSIQDLMQEEMNIVTIIIFGKHNPIVQRKTGFEKHSDNGEAGTCLGNWAFLASLGYGKPQQAAWWQAGSRSAPGRPSLTAPAPSPTNDTKLALSMSIQMPKQKIRLPRTWGKEIRM